MIRLYICVRIRQASFQKSLLTNVTHLCLRKCGFSSSILTEQIFISLSDLKPVIIYFNSCIFKSLSFHLFLLPLVKTGRGDSGKHKHWCSGLASSDIPRRASRAPRLRCLSHVPGWLWMTCARAASRPLGGPGDTAAPGGRADGS